jgi:ATP-dependent Clp protease protease subunit
MAYIPAVTFTQDGEEKAMNLFNKLYEDRIILLHEQVRPESMSTITSQLMFLNAQDSQAPIHLYISSPGGSVMDGFAIIDTMNLIEAPVYTYTMGLAASMGALIFLCGSNRYMLPNSELMLHQPLGGVQGQATDIEITANRIIKMKKKINRIISENSNIAHNKVQQMIDRDRYFDAEECIEKGLADEIITKIIHS